MFRQAFILRSSEDGRRHVCIDVANAKGILRFINADETRKRKFNDVVNIILSGTRDSHIYGPESINKQTKKVTAIKMFQTGHNVRIYCKEQRGLNGTLHIVAAELLEKKTTRKISGRAKSMILKISRYEYQIIENDV